MVMKAPYYTHYRLHRRAIRRSRAHMVQADDAVRVHQYITAPLMDVVGGPVQLLSL